MQQLKYIIAIGWASLVLGCAQPIMPQAQPQPVDAKTKTWVEREVETNAPAIKKQTSKILVADENLKIAPDPRDRVRWESGATAKNQQSLERHANLAAPQQGVNQQTKTYFFETQGQELTVAGLLASKAFKENGKSRYFVEFLNSGDMSEAALLEMNSAFKQLLDKLKPMGLDKNKVITGGSQFNQNKNGIVLVVVKFDE